MSEDPELDKLLLRYVLAKFKYDVLGEKECDGEYECAVSNLVKYLRR